VPYVEVRPAQREDLPAIALVRALTWQSAYAGLVPDDVLAPMTAPAELDAWVDRVTADGSTTCLLAEVDGDLIGFCAYGAEREATTQWRGEVYALYVRPQRWRLGAGSALLHTALDDLAERGDDVVSLWVLHGNDAALSFYRRHGFHETGETITDARGLVERRMLLGIGNRADIQRHPGPVSGGDAAHPRPT
jgi:ribosomal protein S18 acetylase RimI-like enzyme